MVSVDTPEDNKAFAEKEHADFPMLSDPGKEVANAYGVLAQPTAANPNPPQFARRWTFYIGPDGKIVDIDKKVNPANSGADIAAHLKALNVPQKK